MRQNKRFTIVSLVFLAGLSGEAAETSTLAESLLATVKVGDPEKEYAAYQNVLPPSGKSSSCRLMNSQTRCFIQGDLIRPQLLTPVFHKEGTSELVIDQSAWPAGGHFIGGYTRASGSAWVPVGQALNGSDVFRQITDLALSRSAFGCTDGTCSQIISARTGTINVFAQCSLLKIGDLKGFPSHCQPIAVDATSKRWLKANIEFTYSGSNPPISISDSIAVRAAASKGVTDEGLLAAAADALTRQPFLFEKRAMRGPTSMLAIAQPRQSSILKGWYEWPEVTLTVARLTIYVDCDIRVDKYNTERPEDWHDPYPDQQSAYCGSLTDAIAAASVAVCGHFGTIAKHGTNEIECK